MLERRKIIASIVLSECSGEHLTEKEIIMIDLGKVSEATKGFDETLTNDSGAKDGFPE